MPKKDIEWGESEQPVEGGVVDPGTEREREREPQPEPRPRSRRRRRTP